MNEQNVIEFMRRMSTLGSESGAHQRSRRLTANQALFFLLFAEREGRTVTDVADLAGGGNSHRILRVLRDEHELIEPSHQSGREICYKLTERGREIIGLLYG